MKSRVVLILALTFAAYFPVLQGGFVFDDTALITDNRLVRASDGLRRFWVTTEAPDYYPLTWSLWWLEWRLWGGHATGYHIVNLLLHAANVVLVWMVLRRLRIPGAWLAAVLFAIHPVNVATVAWISEQKNTLSMLFFLLSVCAYIRFDETGDRRLYASSLVAFLLALLSKSAVVMLPAVLLGCVWWRRGRVCWSDFWRIVPFMALSLVLGTVTIWFQTHRALQGHEARPDLAFRIAMAGWAPWFYLFKAALPLKLMVIYPKWQIEPDHWTSYVPGVVLIICFAWFWKNRTGWGRAPLFGLGYFVVMLFPVLGFFDQGFYRASWVADHWQYYSIVGVVGLAAAFFSEVPWRRYVTVPVTAALAIATWQRGFVYSNDETLWRDNKAKNPSAFVYDLLGSALLRENKLSEAIQQHQQALRIKPDYPEAHNNLGVAFTRADRLEDAVAEFERALQLVPNYADAHANLGNVLVRLGRVEQAVAHWSQALRVRPSDATIRSNLGIALLQLGRTEEGNRQLLKALKLDPDNSQAHYHLGTGLARLGRMPEAMRQWEEALRIRSDYPEAHYDLGVALAQHGLVHDAIKHWEQVVRAKPDYAEAHFNLGVACASLGKSQEAIRHWQQVLRIKPEYADAHYNLGVAFEQAGTIDEATYHYRQALRIKPDSVEAQNGLARLQTRN